MDDDLYEYTLHLNDYHPDDNDTARISKLIGKREELRLLIHDLEEESKHSQLPALLNFDISLFLFIGTLAITIASYIVLKIPTTHTNAYTTNPELLNTISNLAAFAAVPLAFLSYLNYRKYSADRKRRRLYVRTLNQAQFAMRRAEELISEIARPYSSEITPAPIHSSALESSTEIENNNLHKRKEA
ncbi:hypothetical protein [Archangium violaceum]|uniref:hypothetical protein n=1 Tax=Archangium violaceum TaxID=83451 RepID=UPI00126A77D7|nr:hypothetical protein [Archangium violaceum]